MIMLLIGLVSVYFCFGKRNRNKISKVLFKLISLTYKIPFGLLGLIFSRKGR
jgi:hypothetical protein